MTPWVLLAKTAEGAKQSKKNLSPTMSSPRVKISLDGPDYVRNERKISEDRTHLTSTQTYPCSKGCQKVYGVKFF